MDCPQCGAAALPQATFCIQCGARLGPAARAQAPPPAAPRRKELDINVLAMALYGYDLEALRGQGSKGRDANAQLETLTGLVWALLIEVAALREAMTLGEGGESAMQAAYADAFIRLARLTHNSAGPSGGNQKFLQEFFGGNLPINDYGAVLWEVGALRGLGYTETEIAAYVEDTEQLGTLT